MKLIYKIQERCRERNKLFLALDILFTLSTIYFAFRILLVSIIVGPNNSGDFKNVLFFAMTFSLGLSYAVRVVEMLVIGKRRYFAVTLIAAIIALGIAILELCLLV